MNRFSLIKKIVKRVGILIGLVFTLTIVVSVGSCVLVPVERLIPTNVVNDVTQINPVLVAKIITPTTVAEIVEAVKSHKGPISIGGGRYSMGGQTATESALQIDMREFNKILSLDKAGKTITVQAGARWRQIQEHIDPQDLSVKIMQTYSNFTVGGSLSVNVHGRYVGLGSLIHSVKSLRVVLPGGQLVHASPQDNPEIFYGVIGGYGGLGVIVEATLELADNAKVERQAVMMPIENYKDFFFKSIRESKLAVFHNADIYPDDYSMVHAVSYLRTDKPVTVPDRLIPVNRGYGLDRFVYWIISEWPFGKSFRQYIIDPILYKGESVRWRNYEASYDVAELEPASRQDKTYVLQEYFVPVERFDEFIPKMRQVLHTHKVNVINISVRHAHKDPGALLAWAPNEVFAFVLYYKQGTDAGEKTRVGVWTRELIDAVLDVGGSYYLPYQPHATHEQFLRAYPRAPEFFALKKKLDPENRFRNKLWDKYYVPTTSTSTVISPEIREKLLQKKGYVRDGGQTFLTHPEWFIVYSSDEYAAYLKDGLPSAFPYVASIGQYWANYSEVNKVTGKEYPFNWGYQVMLGVIGASYSVEFTLKSLYENTIGRISEWTAGNELTDEDRYAHGVAKDYGEFIHVRPWYEYDFAGKLAGTWTDIPAWGDNIIRKWERKLILSTEYGIKALYGLLIKLGTGAAYDAETDKIQMVVTNLGKSSKVADSRISVIESLDGKHTLVAAPRYDVFRDVLLGIARADSSALEISEIAGNSDILITGVAPIAWQYKGSRGRVLYAIPLATDDTRKRIAMRVPNRELIAVLRELQSESKVAVDHIYDY